jgi:molybdenum cofactor cytidylyltransferase
MNLAQALRTIPVKPITVAAVGAGGKTSALFQLARDWLSAPHDPSSVILTATSHLGEWQIPLADRHLIARFPTDLDDLPATGLTLVTGPLDGTRTRPLDPEPLARLRAECAVRGWPLLIEADGSRGHPLKAPAEHEPPLPNFVDLVLVVAGLTGSGRPLTEEFIHRPKIFSHLSGLPFGAVVAPEALARVLTHPQGGLKNIPASARKVALLNQADTPELQAQGGKLANLLLAAFDSVVVGALQSPAMFQTFEPIAGILLAAGASTRYGQPKQLLDWRGTPFVRVVAQTALSAGLDPVLVVTGAYAEEVETALQGLPVQIVRNGAWQEGQASSIRASINALTPSVPAGHLPHFQRKWGRTGGGIFLLADQPQVTVPVLQALVEYHRLDLPPVLAPMVQDARANPVLFDRVAFPDLLSLQGDVGGRGIFYKYPPAYLPWHDDRLLLDVDTPEQYRRLVEDETL